MSVMVVYTFNYIEKSVAGILIITWSLVYYLYLITRQDTLTPFNYKFERTKICYERKGASDSFPVKVMLFYM